MVVKTFTREIPLTKVEAAKRRSKTLTYKVTFHYTSITSSNHAVNAATGNPYPFNVGSKDMFRCYMPMTTLHPTLTRTYKQSKKNSKIIKNDTYAN